MTASWRHALRLAPFGVGIFLSAMLLFWIQPLAGKTLLPALGGSAGVWIACLAIFQLTLLGGYAWSAFLASLRFPALQLALHGALLAAAWWQLPLETGLPLVEESASPLWQVWRILAERYGLILVLLAATSPLLQHWYARLAPDRDPYYLYAASNAGSLLGLLIFPFYLEPWKSLPEQASWWGMAAAAFAFCLAAAGLLSLNAAPGRETAAKRPVAWRSAARWIAYSFLAASLLSGFSEYLTRDIAPVPLLWVIPLALYLIAFILAFGRGGWLTPAADTVYRFFAPLFVLIASQIAMDSWVVALWLPLFFSGCFVLLRRLREEAPEAQSLTFYYLCLAFGGMLGGLFNALAAPALFRTAPEFALVQALIVFALPVRGGGRTWLPYFPFLPFCLLALVVGMEWLLRHVLTDGAHVRLAALLVILAWCLAYWPAPRRMGAMLLAACLGMQLGMAFDPHFLYRQRNFYGTLAVQQDERGEYHSLRHGTTRHGLQKMEEAVPTPLAYYHPSGPAGDAFAVLAAERPQARIGVVGLGTGSMSCLAKAGMALDYYEINPLVGEVAANPRYFTYLSACPSRWSLVEGDARRRLPEGSGAYDLIALDAFSSDAVPVHLLTREAMALYLARLKPGGALLVHVSNRYLDLARVLLGHGQALGMRVLERYDTDEKAAKGKSASHWVALTQSPAWEEALRRRGWSEPSGKPVTWTDSHSSLWAVWK